VKPSVLFVVALISFSACACVVGDDQAVEFVNEAQDGLPRSDSGPCAVAKNGTPCRDDGSLCLDGLCRCVEGGVCELPSGDNGVCVDGVCVP